MNKITILFIVISFSELIPQSDFWEKKLEVKSDICSIAFDSKNNIYVGTDYDGFFKSINNGKTWENKENGLSYGRTECIAINSDDVIFCGVSFNGHLIMGPDPLGLFFSTDYGETWKLAYKTVWLHSIFIDSKNIVFACGNTFNLKTDIVVSNGNWKKWRNIVDGLPESFITDMIGNKNETLFATRFEGGLYKSENKGEGWALIEDKLKNKRISKITSGSDGSLYAMVDSLGLFKSTDEGIFWEKINYESDTTHVYNFIVDKYSNIYLACEKGLLVSKDKGRSWQIISDNLKDREITSIVIDKNGYIYAVMVLTFPELVLYRDPRIRYELYKSKNVIIK